MSIEHQTRITEGPMTADEILRWRADGWRLYSVIRPVSDGDKQHSYHFRRQPGGMSPIGDTPRLEPSGPKPAA